LQRWSSSQHWVEKRKEDMAQLAQRVKEGLIEQTAMRSLNSYKDMLKVSEDLNQHLLLFVNVAEVHDDVPSRPPQGKPWQYFVPCFLPIVPSFGRSAVHF
jgi:hypothetical protein